jgi:hypothetical protein
MILGVAMSGTFDSDRQGMGCNSHDPSDVVHAVRPRRVDAMTYSHAEATLLAIDSLARETEQVLLDLSGSDPDLARQLRKEWAFPSIR